MIIYYDFFEDRVLKLTLGRDRKLVVWKLIMVTFSKNIQIFYLDSVPQA